MLFRTHTKSVPGFSWNNWKCGVWSALKGGNWRHTVSWDPVAVYQNKNWAQMLRRAVRPGLDQRLASHMGEEAERKQESLQRG